jgi:TIR domain
VRPDGTVAGGGPAEGSRILVESVLTMAHDVFISHSHVDKPAADAACAVLEARGIRCWIAPRDIGPGQEWAASIIRAIREAKIMLLVFSRHANESSQVRREVERAAHSEKVLLPLRIDDVLPGETLEFFLSTPHWLDAITPPLEAHLEKLADTCTSLLAALDTDHGSATSEAARPPSPGPATPGRSFAAPAPALNPAGAPTPAHRSSSSPAPGPNKGSWMRLSTATPASLLCT